MVSTALEAPWPVAAALMATAAFCWPDRLGRTRLGAVLPAACVNRSPRLRRWPAPSGGLGVGALAAPLGWALAGVGGAVAATLAVCLGHRRWKAARDDRRHDEDVAALLDAVALVAGELRAGAHPASAVASAAVGTGVVPRILGAIAAGARLGGDVPELITRHAAAEPVVGVELRRLGAAWELAGRHGVPLAELLEAVRVDLDARVRFRARVRAELAGPRATAAVLAGLPLLGLLLGEAVGAAPTVVLRSTTAGQLLLVVGTGLICGGVLWSARIMSKAVGR